jgi:putative DNA primase/helicase
MQSLPERMFAAGVTDLISVIPPGATLTPSSKIPQAALGKIPGKRHPSGLWSGMQWRTHVATAVDVRQWVTDGANIGLRTTRFPAVDVDCKDAILAQIITDHALALLGPAPIRTGNPPKRLLLYRNVEPFGRMRLWIRMPDQQEHLVEVLGEGQQAVVVGTHPSGKTYEWAGDPTDALTVITRDLASSFLDSLQALIEREGFGTCEREGDGRRVTHAAASDQTALRAPSLDALRECVERLPNLDTLFPGRTDYLRVGYAIKAAAGPENDEDGCELFIEWAARWDAGVTAPEQAREDWRRMTGPSSVGWSYLSELARAHGFNAAGYEFDVIDGAKPAPDALQSESDGPIKYSDQWLAEECVARYRGELRFVPERGSWIVWDGARWRVDAELLADDLILRGLRTVAANVMKEGAKGAARLALDLCSSARASSVTKVARSNRAIVVNVSSLDHDPWMLNTPAGLVDLRTGHLQPPNPDVLATRLTAVAPTSQFTPEWLRFLNEATGKDPELIGYMQRLCGYCLTGSTIEQQITFIFGPGQNGKSVFLNVLSGVLGDYAKTSTAEVFAESRGDKHSTDLADLAGARLVVASETKQGSNWNVTRIKSLSGGEAQSARFMRQDNFTFTPQCKLVFTGNHQPELRDVNVAIRRRIHMVPFTVTPAKRDNLLGEKLRTEWPGILSWMIEGCLQWQKYGLVAPPVVYNASQEYFDAEDVFGGWLSDCIEVTQDEGDYVTSLVLYRSWAEWANARHEHPGSAKRLSQAMSARGFKRMREKGTQHRGFSGLKLKQDGELTRLLTT